MAGKSTLAKRIKEWYPKMKVQILCQDDFVIPQKQIPLIKGKTDWENPVSVDFDEYIASVVARNIENQLVIAEGLFAFSDSVLCKLYDKKIFLEIPQEVFFERKRLDTRWGIEPEWYVKHIWESHLKYGLLPKTQTDVFMIDGTEPVDLVRLKKYLDIN